MPTIAVPLLYILKLLLLKSRILEVDVLKCEDIGWVGVHVAMTHEIATLEATCTAHAKRQHVFGKRLST